LREALQKATGQKVEPHAKDLKDTLTKVAPKAQKREMTQDELRAMLVVDPIDENS